MGRRIVLTLWGSDGDLFPFVSIAQELQSRGHQVAIASAAAHRGTVERTGVTFLAIRPDVPDFFPEELADPRRAVEILIRQMVLPCLKDTYADLMAVCRGADLIVSHVLSFAVPFVAEQLKVPWMSVILQPMSLFSRYDPPYLLSAPWLYSLRRLGAWPYSVLWAMFRASRRSWFKPIDNLGREQGLGPSASDWLSSPRLSPMWSGTLAAFSREFAREQPDWPQPSWVTGFVWTDTKRALSSGLQEFLAKQNVPIVFTLGDSTSRFPGDFYGHSLEAVRRLGCRAVFLTGLHAKPVLPEVPPDQVFVADFEPYSEVFPRVAAVVHSGGIGSIALALRARRPMLLAPLFFDQADNAQRACRLGFARVLEFRRYTAAGACRELRELLVNPSYSQRAAEIGTGVDAEDGVRAACERIESVLLRRNST